MALFWTPESLMQKSRVCIAVDADPFKAQLRLIEERFSSDGVVLHHARNIVKQFTLNKNLTNIPVTGIPHTIVVKSFKIPDAIQGWIYAHWRPGKARRSFEYAKRLQRLGINTHRPLAYTETFAKGRLRESYFFSELIDHDCTIRDILNQGDEVDLDVIRQFVAFTYAMHKKNILHLDHSPGNTLIKKRGNTCHFSIIDINRMQFRKVNLQDGLKNFARLSHNLMIIKHIAHCYAEYTRADPAQCYRILRQYQRKEHTWRTRKQYLKRLAKRLVGH